MEEVRKRADEMREEAIQNASRILQDAENRADERENQAIENAERILLDAQKRAARLLNHAEKSMDLEDILDFDEIVEICDYESDE